MIVLPTADPNQAAVNFLVLSATGKASTDGFDDFHGAIFAGEGRVRTNFLERTGHQLLGALYSNRQYTSVDQRLGFVINNRALAKREGTWAVYYNFDQFLYETDKAAGHGVGLFGPCVGEFRVQRLAVWLAAFLAISSCGFRTLKRDVEESREQAGLEGHAEVRGTPGHPVVVIVYRVTTKRIEDFNIGAGVYFLEAYDPQFSAILARAGAAER